MENNQVCFTGTAESALEHKFHEFENPDYLVRRSGVLSANRLFFVINNVEDGLTTRIEVPRCEPVDISFVFSIHRERSEDGITVIINVKNFWEETGYLRDHYKGEELRLLDPILEASKLQESTESHYWYEGKLNIRQLKERLISLGLEHDRQFQRFMDRWN